MVEVGRYISPMTAYFVTLVKPLIFWVQKKKISSSRNLSYHLFGLGMLHSGTNCLFQNSSSGIRLFWIVGGQVRRKLDCEEKLGIIFFVPRHCIFISLRSSCDT